MENTNDIAAYKKSIQRQRVHIFLARLDEDFEQVRGEVLRKDSLPVLEECYALIQREAVRRATLNVESENIDSSVMVARNRPNLKLQEQPRLQQTQPQDQLRLNARSRGTTKQSYKCTHCDQTGHTKERCYELVGYPEWWDHSRDSKKRGSGQNATAALTEGKVNGDNEVAKRATVLIATAGNNIGKVLNMSVPVLNNTWIIDSGATDHMTFDSRQISSLRQSSQKCVSTANGASALVIGEGALSLTDTLNLESVLVVPSLEYNLLLVAQITLTLHCVSSLDTAVDTGVNSLDTSSVEDSPVIETASLSEPLSLQPDTHNHSLVEDVLESVPNSPRRNPPRSNKGIPKLVYEPELTSKAKYPMS
ncbi:hypothetical protein RHGRI_017567 [Rhododendron griersonianum]|uniref:Retrovirus-related Pol polyprotein from transposon TNT 1-94-like beta-barrel domain-containing protein n=1 Tax=Rhododendron griersonianum TaxID=479676 RepID=A0AAV6JY77_9ERIC|nr:hypothetical protein RHGRI_017567 [Rhododendron griersonianum]